MILVIVGACPAGRLLNQKREAFMKSRIIIGCAGLACVSLLAACSPADETTASAKLEQTEVEKTTATADTLVSGINKSHFDTTVQPQDDFYRYVNGTWLENTEIPADKSNYGTFTKLADEAERQIRGIIEQAASTKQPAGSEAQKIGDLYTSFMEEKDINKKGLQPLT
ncbi:MAG TPA: hypothetical protein VFP95_07430, partial [Gammaproteobacteria bacterium]|nr:hypothetical protein [Gammaproteobacteria bacterium]